MKKDNESLYRFLSALIKVFFFLKKFLIFNKKHKWPCYSKLFCFLVNLKSLGYSVFWWIVFNPYFYSHIQWFLDNKMYLYQEVQLLLIDTLRWIMLIESQWYSQQTFHKLWYSILITVKTVTFVVYKISAFSPYHVEKLDIWVMLILVLGLR